MVPHQNPYDVSTGNDVPFSWGDEKEGGPPFEDEFVSTRENKILSKIGLEFVKEFEFQRTPCNWYEKTK